MEKFFIVGCPRSGTTMVQQGLNRHSQIAIPPETKFFFSFVGHARAGQAKHLQRLHRDLKISLPEPSKPVRTIREARWYFDNMARLYVQRLDKPDIAYFGEKTPEHTSRLSMIRKLYPRAKIIFLYRDGRDVALSLSRVPWMPQDLYVNFMVWLYYYRILNNALNGAWGRNIYFSKYEDIVADPEKEFAGMLQFLGLPYQPTVAHGSGNQEGIPDRELSWKKRALEKITPERVGLFRHDLSSEQINILERLGHHALRSLGYQTQGGRASLSLGFFCRLLWNMGKVVFRLPWHTLANEFLGDSLRHSSKGNEVTMAGETGDARERFPTTLNLVKLQA